MSEHERPREARVVIPVVEEEVRVDRRTRTTGTVRVDKRVRTEPVEIDEVLLAEEVVVERVPMDQWVDRAPEPRMEGETWVMPVVEEVLVVERRLRLREEVRVTRRASTRREVREVHRRIEEVDVQRTDGPDGPDEP